MFSVTCSVVVVKRAYFFLSQVLAKCGQSFHMEFYRTCHLYNHGKLFYFLLNGESDRGRKGLRVKDGRDDEGRYGNRDA